MPWDRTRRGSRSSPTEDLKKKTIPTLVLHDDDDQIVPIAAAGLRSAKVAPDAQLKVYKGYPHGFFTVHHEQANADMLAFFKS